MKILFLGPSYSIHLKHWIKFFYNKNWEVYYIGVENNFEEYNKYIKKIYLIKNRYSNFFLQRWFFKLISMLELKKIIKKIKPDIINIHWIDNNALLSFFIKDIPIVLSAWGSDVLIFPFENKKWKMELKIYCNKTDLVLSIAPHMTDILINKIGVNQEKIYTTLWGCDTKVFFRNQEIEKGDKTIRVIYTRSFKSVYNWKTLVKAIPIVLKEREDIEFILVGSGSEENEAKSLIKRYGAEQKVSFLGRLSQERLAEELNKSHIFISVSLSDGNNISLNEAMACGVFPICSDTPAHKQWIGDNETGWILKDNFSEKELAEKILAYNKDDIFVKNAIKKNYEIVKERADFYKNLSKIEEIFIELIKKNNKRK